MTKVDYYELLSVSKDADGQEIKTAYRKLAMQYHPDRNPDNPEAEAKFKECSEAYSVLSDAEKRAAYDRYGHAAFSGGGGGGGNPFQGAGGGFAGQDMGDIFGDIFGEMFNMGGSGRKGSRVQRGRDLRYDMSLEFTEAAFGVEKEITIRREEVCNDCEGSGAARGKPAATCPQCKGAGQMRFQQGFFSVARTCPRCGGTGTVITDPCKTCQGRTTVEHEHRLTVKVPAGVEEGTRIRYQGEGESGKYGGPSGDLYVVLSVKKHKFFERDGDDLHCVMPISFPQAVLGTELQIETLEGAESIKVPEGTQSGKEFRLRGKGVPHLNERGKGDLIVEVRVATPTKLNKQQRELVKQLGETMVVENAPHSRGLIDKVKDIFS
uniref:molecular chaperone DnaJ n=1 Tax=Granulicella tundricola TaxID=940615 RepID=UPI0038CBFBAD